MHQQVRSPPPSITIWSHRLSPDGLPASPRSPSAVCGTQLGAGEGRSVPRSGTSGSQSPPAFPPNIHPEIREPRTCCSARGWSAASWLPRASVTWRQAPHTGSRPRSRRGLHLAATRVPQPTPPATRKPPGSGAGSAHAEAQERPGGAPRWAWPGSGRTRTQGGAEASVGVSINGGWAWPDRGSQGGGWGRNHLWAGPEPSGQRRENPGGRRGRSWTD